MRLVRVTSYRRIDVEQVATGGEVQQACQLIVTQDEIIERAVLPQLTEVRGKGT